MFCVSELPICSKIIQSNTLDNIYSLITPFGSYSKGMTGVIGEPMHKPKLDMLRITDGVAYS